MAGLFNIFSESENLHSLSSNKGKDNSQNVNLAKLKIAGTSGFTSAKGQLQSQNKPKGLSIRSKSDLNVSTSAHSEFRKQYSKDCLNLESKLNITKNKSFCSPTKLKIPKSKSFSNSTPKKLSPKISSPIMQAAVNEFIFAKPATPKPLKKSPELLANYCDPIELMDAEMEAIFKSDLAMIRSVLNNSSTSSLDDEGFISDPEQDSFSPFESSMSFVDKIDIELPDISDFED